MNADRQDPVAELLLKSLVFDMYSKGLTQDAIASYVGKRKKTVNDLLKPLAKWERRESAK